MIQDTFLIRAGTIADIPLILSFIKELAAYEKLLHDVVATEEMLRESLFGAQANAKVIIGELNKVPVCYAIYFTTFSTFTGRPGLYLEDLFVTSEMRGRGFGRKLLAHLAAYAVQHNYKRIEWSVLNWNKTAIDFYDSLGAKPSEGWTVYRLSEHALEQLGATPGA